MDRDMNIKSQLPGSSSDRVVFGRQPWWSMPGAFLATLLALPVHAGVTFPNEPLATGIRVAPNILFILDDSGSMAWENVNNGSITEITGAGSFSDKAGKNGVTDGYENDLSAQIGNSWMYEQNYITNTQFYNPGTTYQPWVAASGNRVTGGSSYDKAYSSTNIVTYTDPLTGASTSSGTINLADATRVFYVPKVRTNSNATYLSKVENYYRYHIPSGGSSVIRSEYGLASFGSWQTLSVDPSSGSVKGSGYKDQLIAGVSSGYQLNVSVKATDRSTWFWVYDPDGVDVCNGRNQVNSGNTETCSVVPSKSGTYKIVTQRWEKDNDNSSKYELSARQRSTDSCGPINGSYGWINCTPATPTGRTVAEEKKNFAIWYSYYRTRIKSAKGGAAEAFNTQGRKVRVGYRSLHQNNTTNFDIPVNDGNDGRFVNGDTTQGDAAVTTSRSTWFNRLFSTTANNGTPLQTVLDNAGKYFQQTGSSGPYGPESGVSQFSCRQNFTILTTDGYWNGTTVNVGTDGDDNDGPTYNNGLLATDPNYKSGGYKKSDPYKDGYSSTLADIAMKYWKTDLRGLANNVPDSAADPAFWQHMVTFTISIGLKTTKGWSSVSDVPKNNPGWPEPSTNNAANIDDLLHAAVNGHGSFIAASSPKEFADGLAAALATINERTGSFSNATASDATSLNTGTKIFKASYVSGAWSGGLKSESVISGAEEWQATIPDYSTRKNQVFTYESGSGTSFPTSSQITALDKTGYGAASYEVSGTDNAAYIMGDKSLEGTGPGQLRVRSKLLGDIVNSSPAYVPETDTVYVGANDGMLHAFDASTGGELFAYVPGLVNLASLKNLSAGDYTHQWFVDGPIAVSKRSLGPGNTNILVGTLGRGGKGVYALDVTNPGSFAASNVKWERKDTAGKNMGMVLGAPILGKVRNSTSTPAVILGNGPNSTSGKAVLVVLDMADGSVIREIPTDNTTDNGLFAPTGLYAADGKTLVYAYAGDLQGNIWKFDMTSTSPASWSASKVFHAEKTAGKPQPITAGLATAVDVRTNKRWVFFGTGSYMTAADGSDKSANAQSMYGVIDDGSAYTRANLTQRTITKDPGTEQRYFGDFPSLAPSPKDKGWYVDLPEDGERIVQNAQIDGSFLVTASMMPSGDSCADAGGSGYINAITPFPGIASGRSYFDLDGSGGTDDTGTSGKPTGSVKTNGMPTLPVLLPGQAILNLSSGATQKMKKGQALWTRVSWREIRSD